MSYTRTIPAAIRKYEVVIVRKRSWPAVSNYNDCRQRSHRAAYQLKLDRFASHIDSTNFLSLVRRSVSERGTKSTPVPPIYFCSKVFSANRVMRHVFPTPASPTTTSLGQTRIIPVGRSLLGEQVVITRHIKAKGRLKC